MGLCIIHHLLPIEASQIRVEKCSNLWIYGYNDISLEVSFIRCPFNKIVVIGSRLGPGSVFPEVLSPVKVE